MKTDNLLNKSIKEDLNRSWLLKMKKNYFTFVKVVNKDQQAYS